MTIRRDTTVRLGFSVPAGAPVDIPVRHTCITGQTQEAGKTTALEALITRSGLKALAFITKPGEGSFSVGRRIDPHFREAADWQFVSSILEASRGEKLKFERAWIMRASRGASTLADVQANVRAAMEKARGLAADVYLVLDNYLEAVVPTIASVAWAPAIDLAPGLNVMDLAALPIEMQHLVIRSSIDWVLHRETGTVVVIPEAWKFIPQGRGTPVKHAAEAFIRQAAGRGNYLWLDSQDIGGVEKAILRSVPVWICGVQREANEIKRTLENIPSNPKPTKTAMGLLGLGEFYACWGQHAIRTYVQPTWLTEDQAAAVARGERLATAPRRASAHRVVHMEDHVHPTPTVVERLAILPGRRAKVSPPISIMPVPAPAPAAGDLEDTTMNPTQEKKLDALIESVGSLAKAIAQQHTPPARPLTKTEAAEVGLVTAGLAAAHGIELPPVPAAPDPGAIAAETQHGMPVALLGTLEPEQVAALYLWFRDRFLDDLARWPEATVLKVLQQRPEIRLETVRASQTASAEDLTGRIALLILAGWFDEGKGATATAGEMARRAWRHDYRDVDKAARKLAAKGFLRIQDKKFVAVPGMKASIVEVQA